ncbi:GNAT family N-acetyltransferase [Streptomyces sp. JJ36]|uniref:GNAT family N-acetyltransferase n=1 Tax=Streptomyces sp. JJ36 TaxID=2736645 RepID=UPI001F45F0BF|nr:GNAT family N-acetyltransferase [Streptomyces sp. JJ36]MCF6522481.1 GNAT family N-acetyltransferase [Streptomyces sp. JJ36]
MRTCSFPEAGTPAGLRAQVVALEDEAWPSRDAPAGRPPGALSHDPALHPVSLLLVEEETVLAALSVLSTEFAHAGARFTAAGLSTVVTRRAVRGRGYGRRLVAEARTALAEGGRHDLALFTCDRPLQRFYESAGWRPLPGAVLVGGTPDDPFPSDFPGFDKVVMGDFFSAAARRARDSFQRCRIGLHPGEIDRLW